MRANAVTVIPAFAHAMRLESASTVACPSDCSPPVPTVTLADPFVRLLPSPVTGGRLRFTFAQSIALKCESVRANSFCKAILDDSSSCPLVIGYF